MIDVRNLEAQVVIREGLELENWTDEQNTAMRTALDCLIRMDKIRAEEHALRNGTIDLTYFGERVSKIIFINSPKINGSRPKV